MSAYVIVEVNVTDPEQFAEYRKLVLPTIEKYGGRYLVRGGATTILEGSWRPSRVVVLEFPDEETAKRFYASPEYGAARAKRAGAANMNMVLASGVSA